MRRRQFIALLGSAAVARPVPSRAQQPVKVSRIALITSRPPASDLAGLDPSTPAISAFVQALAGLGYVEGRNLFLERWSEHARGERYREIVGDLARRAFDVIVSVDNELAFAAKDLKSTVPIVMAASVDPVGSGIVASLARPGGNITGLTVHAGPEFEAKRLQLLKEAVANASRVAFLGSKGDWEGPEGQSVRAAGRTIGIDLVHAEHADTYYNDAFAFMAAERPHALFVARTSMNHANRHAIVGFAAGQRLPGIYPDREAVEAGGLASYGASITDLFRRAAGYVDKILKGARPADLPVEQPTRFELVINLKTAKALGIAVPPSILLRADEVIE